MEAEVIIYTDKDGIEMVKVGLQPTNEEEKLIIKLLQRQPLVIHGHPTKGII